MRRGYTLGLRSRLGSVADSDPSCSERTSPNARVSAEGRLSAADARLVKEMALRTSTRRSSRHDDGDFDGITEIASGGEGDVYNAQRNWLRASQRASEVSSNDASSRRDDEPPGELRIWRLADGGTVESNRLGGFLISGAMLYVFAPASSNAVAYRFAFPSVSNMLSSWCQYEALKYVSFPTQMLFKCFKLFPIMVMGKVLGNKVYPTYDYVVALVIGVGIAVFSVSTEELDIGQDSIGEIETVGGTICGVILLLFFLLFDSFTGQYQARLFNEHPDLSPYQMMFMVNTFSMVFSFVTLVHTHELYALCEFVYDHADMHIHLIVFSLASTVGQLFIFKTIKAFGPVIFAICMNTRIILSILLSALIYGHDITPPGMVGLLLVFSAIAYRIKRKTDADGKPLIKWAGMNDDKSMDVFHEWHEHCDM